MECLSLKVGFCLLGVSLTEFSTNSYTEVLTTSSVIVFGGGAFGGS